eukprot:scaffold124609_cov24-Prasinocladus_malaysianus.AAC.1
MRKAENRSEQLIISTYQSECALYRSAQSLLLVHPSVHHDTIHSFTFCSTPSRALYCRLVGPDALQPAARDRQ